MLTYNGHEENASQNDEAEVHSRRVCLRVSVPSLAKSVEDRAASDMLMACSGTRPRQTLGMSKGGEDAHL